MRKAHTIKKFLVIKMLEIFREYGCETINDAINLINKELKYDDDVVFSWNLGGK